MFQEGHYTVELLNSGSYDHFDLLIKGGRNLTVSSLIRNSREMRLFSILLFFVQYSIALPIRFSPSTALEIKLIQLQIWLEKTWFEKNSKLRE